MVTAEALACGTPVLGTPVGATPELLRPLDEHLVMRSTEPADIAQGIAQFLERPDLAEWRERCRRYAEQRFDWRHVVERYEAVFERIIAARHESGRARLLPRP
jgi:glycosyltransferase involved in cell wall biosynthesis